MSSVRDIVPNRSLQAGGILPGAASVFVQSTVDADIAAFYPHPGGVHVISGITANRTYTITNAVIATYDCKIGEGFEFKVKNADDASSVILAVAGVTSAGPGTISVAAGACRSFSLCRTAENVWRLDSLGAATF